MKPSGPLMKEHRRIEKMIALIEDEISRIRQSTKVDPAFIDAAVDFIRTYADRTHHGKEEDILFASLEDKQLSADHAALMKELVEEHVYARGVVAELIHAKDTYVHDGGRIDPVVAQLEKLVRFYPAHIEKEDKVFFPAAMEYLSADGKKGMLQEFDEFDREMIHEKYMKLVDQLQNRPRHREVP
jgi:hemerythrin-like domain-containing protein